MFQKKTLIDAVIILLMLLSIVLVVSAAEPVPRKYVTPTVGLMRIGDKGCTYLDNFLVSHDGTGWIKKRSVLSPKLDGPHLEVTRTGKGLSIKMVAVPAGHWKAEAYNPDKNLWIQVESYDEVVP